MNQNICHNKTNENQKNIISQRYLALIDAGVIKKDLEQLRITELLDDLQLEIDSNSTIKESFFSRIFASKKKIDIKGVYLWGGVGRGKSMLMDLFYESCSVKQKSRVHFHSFMSQIHKEIHKWRRGKNNTDSDPIIPLAKQIAAKSKLLCFDEFQVTDITDAMILGRLFDQLFIKGVIVFATSNRPIDDLYKDGLQRERFLPFIDLFKQKMNEVEIKSETDYRLSKIKSLSTSYRFPLDEKSDKFLNDAFNKLTNHSNPESVILEVSGRKLVFDNCYSGVLLTSFDQLCSRPLGAEDYIEISRSFNTVLLANIPKLTPEYRNEAKRFVTLIDELYEHNVKLICTADASTEQLYVSGDGSFEFDRTVSRLKEMQSSSYINKKG